MVRIARELHEFHASQVSILGLGPRPCLSKKVVADHLVEARAALARELLGPREDGIFNADRHLFHGARFAGCLLSIFRLIENTAPGRGLL